MTPTTGSNLFDLFIALATLAAVLVPVLLQSRRLKKVQADIKTNHGMTPAQYLEMVAEVKDDLFDMRFSQLELKEILVTNAEALVEHTKSDTKNFNELKQLIEEQNK